MSSVIETSEASLSRKEFIRLRDWVHQETGIFLADSKMTMMGARLNKRLRELGLSSYDEYYEVLTNADPRKIEREQLINAITTNKTDFFRENHHFEFLKSRVFPLLEQRAQAGHPKKVRLWSAACSTGEEPYSIAMTVNDYFMNKPGWDIRILATDIDTNVLTHAQKGMYDEERVQGMPPATLKRYFRRIQDRGRNRFEVSNDLKQLITFRQLNFMDATWPFNAKFDVVFCRNVIIYFNADTQDRLMRRFHSYLMPHSHLFLGHSESLLRLQELYDAGGQTIYSVRPGSIKAAPEASAAAPVKAIAPANETSKSLVQRAGGEASVPTHSIIVGEVHASATPCVVRTVLGSCVAICLYDPRARVGGMNHFMLPNGHGGNAASYGAYAADMLINEIMKCGGDRRRLVAKIFGGASVIPDMTVHEVGKNNVEFADNYLATEKIPVLARFVGGEAGMQVVFNTYSGKAVVRLLDNRQSIDAEKNEEKQFATWEKKIADESSSVTLF